MDDVIAFAKANPGKLRVNIASNGSPHHLNLLAFLKGTGIEVEQIPYPGSAPSQNAALTGEIDMVFTSVAEQAPLLKGGKLRPLGLLTDKDETFAGIGTIPTLLDKYPSLKEHLPIFQVLGMGVEKGCPAGKSRQTERRLQESYGHRYGEKVGQGQLLRPGPATSEPKPPPR